MGKKKRKWNLDDEVRLLNQLTYNMYLDQLTELAIGTIEWVGAPPTLDNRFLEMTLFGKGMGVFFVDDVVGPLALEVMIGGPFDIYDYPTRREAYSPDTEFRVQLDPSNSVMIYNNYLRQPWFNQIDMYARRLAEIERTVDVNVRAQQTPKILTATENQRLVLENLYKQYSGHYPFIFGDKGLDFQQLNSIDTTSPFVSDKLQIVKRQIWNEALTFLGIENNSSEKAERLVASESLANVGAVEAQRFARLNARNDACKKIKEMFGIDMHAEFRAPLSAEVIRDETIAQTEVLSGGEVHNGTENSM